MRDKTRLVVLLFSPKMGDSTRLVVPLPPKGERASLRINASLSPKECTTVRYTLYGTHTGHIQGGIYRDVTYKEHTGRHIRGGIP